MFPTKRIPSILLLLLAAIIAGTAGYSAFKPSRTQTVSYGVPSIGGSFTLTDTVGNRVSDTNYRGKFMLVLFGYTYCPDICPAELQIVSAVLDRMGSKVADVQPLFISVDPERDTPSVLRDYMKNFHPKFVGLTGTPEEIAQVAKEYGVYYAKDAGGPTDYLMDHSTIIYLMDRNGKFLKHFTYGIDVQQLADGINQAIAGS